MHENRAISGAEFNDKNCEKIVLEQELYDDIVGISSEEGKPMEERVCTVGDLASRTAEVLDTVKATKTPTFIDQGGSSSTVLVDADTYLTDMQALREFNRIYRDSSIRPSESITGSGKSIS